MKVQTSLKISVLFVAAAFGTQTMVGAAAKPPEQPFLTAGVTAGCPLTPPAKELKKKPTNIEMYQFESSPLGSRTPLLMVHGLRGEFWKDCFRWQKLATYLNDDSNFRDHYKIYFARYDSYAPLNQLSGQFAAAVQNFSKSLGGKTFDVMALSLGGNVVADAMNNSDADACIRRVLTFGTPFHGSPLFTASWMEYSMLKSHWMPLTQMDTIIPYQIYFSKHRNLTSNLHWDNADAMVPNVGTFRLWFNPLRARPLSPEATANKPVFQGNEAALVNKSKFTCYGGYIGTASADNGRSNGRIKGSLTWFAKTVVPEHMGKEHAVLRSLNRQMTFATAGKAADRTEPYALNDGITPLVSSLFLPNDRMSGTSISDVTKVGELAGKTDVHRARVFANIDHLTFIDDYHPPGAPIMVQDELSQSKVAQPIFAWILHDLVSDTPAEELAVGPKRKKASAD
jgi:hypothetical protein